MKENKLMVTVDATGKKEEISADRVRSWMSVNNMLHQTLVSFDVGTLFILETPEEFTVAFRRYWIRYGQQNPIPVPKLDSGCPVPPPGWRCTREPGHPGPCAAKPDLGNVTTSGPFQTMPEGQMWAEILQGIRDEHADDRRKWWLSFEDVSSNQVSILAGEIIAIRQGAQVEKCAGLMTNKSGCYLHLRTGSEIFVCHSIGYVHQMLFGPKPVDGNDPRA